MDYIPTYMDEQTIDFIPSYTDSLMHHGIMGQKWGTRNGPPYPLGGGDYSPSEEKAIKAERKNKYSRYNKKHYDTVLDKGTTLRTLSFDKDRTQKGDMFFASHTKVDVDHYKEFFNKPAPQEIYDKDGNKIGTGNFFKYSIQNKLAKDAKIASEDSGAKIFADLYKKDRDFYNFVSDPTRLRKVFTDDAHRIGLGYRRALKVVDKLQDPDYTPTSKEVKDIYKLFNHSIPADGHGDTRVAKDVATQRAKFFNEAKKNGYSGILDLNDALYNTVQAQSPVIMFDTDAIIPEGAYRTTHAEVLKSKALTWGRRFVGAM